jgi:hypothetical protein
VGGEFKLEDLSILQALKNAPFYDHSLGKNLKLSADYFILGARTRYDDTDFGQSLPSYREQSNNLSLNNDAKAKPHFSLDESDFHSETQWTLSQARSYSMSLRLPLWFEFQLLTSGGQRESHDTNKALRQSGLTAKVFADGGLEWHTASNLSLSVHASWNSSSKSWEGVEGPSEQHVKWTASLEQSLGPQSVLRLDYGRPALLGYDFGLQDTVPVLTLSGKIYL